MTNVSPAQAKDVAQLFYGAFQRKDAAAMISQYHKDVEFHDPVFPELRGKDAKDMWRMLCTSSADLKVEFAVKSVQADQVRVAWQAWYTFSKTGRRVHNCITAELTIVDGKIRTHRDRFSFWRWSRQALGPAGWLLGWSPLLRNKVRGIAAQSLRQFQQRAAS